MILGNNEIAERNLITVNYEPSDLQPASYDLRTDRDYLIGSHQSVLINTMESVDLPGDVSGMLKDKSSYLRMKIVIGQGFVDPGFTGTLTVLVTNLGRTPVLVPYGTPFCQIVFYSTGNVGSLYNGHYQNQNGIRGSVLNTDIEDVEIVEEAEVIDQVVEKADSDTELTDQDVEKTDSDAEVIDQVDEKTDSDTELTDHVTDKTESNAELTDIKACSTENND